MITITIIICLTVIFIIAIICYKEYKLSNNCRFVTIECDLKSLSHKLELNNSILESLADSISHLPKQGNRLHIVAQIVAAIYANHQAAKGFKSIEELVHKALDIADTLIKESEKGGK